MHKSSLFANTMHIARTPCQASATEADGCIKFGTFSKSLGAGLSPITKGDSPMIF